MTLQKPPEKWTEADLQALVDGKIDESSTLEYKETVDLDTPAHRQEAVKDLSAFANAQGGILVYGVREDKRREGPGVPVELVPLQVPGIRERLEDTVLNGVTPRFEYLIHSVPAEAPRQGYYLVVHVPQSFDGVHMVTLNGVNRYYKRRNFRVEPMTEDEVRQAYARVFALGRNLSERCSRECHLVPDDWFGVRLTTVPMIDNDQFIDPREHGLEHFRERLEERHRELAAVLKPDIGKMFHVNGRTPGRPEFAVHIRYDGHVEVLRAIVTERPAGGRMAIESLPLRLPSRDVVDWLRDDLDLCATVYEAVAYQGPIRIRYQLTGAHGTALGVGATTRTADKRFPQNTWATESDTYVWRIRLDPRPIIHEIMDRVWIAYGESRCALFSDDHELMEKG